MRPQRGFTLIELLVVIAIIAILAAILFPVFANARKKSEQAACLAHQKQIGLAVMMYVQDFDQAYPPAGEGTGANPNWAERVNPYVKSLELFTCPTGGIAYNYIRRSFGLSRQAADQLYAIYGVRNFSANAYVIAWLNPPYPRAGPGRIRYDADIEQPSQSIMFSESVGVGTVLHRAPGTNTPVPNNMQWWWAISDECWVCAEAGRDQDLDENIWTSLLLHNGGANYTLSDGHAKWYRPDQTYMPRRCEGQIPKGNMWQWGETTIERCGNDCSAAIRASVTNYCR